MTHTAQLDRGTLAAIRELLEMAYEDFSENDWQHTIGGMHAILRAGEILVGHGAAVQRAFLHLPPGGTAWRKAKPLRVGYIEGVAVRADRRRRGIGGALTARLDEVVRRAYDAGALSASDEGRSLYYAQGWVPWRGQTYVISATGMTRTKEEDEGIFILPVTDLDVAGGLACDWRSGDVW
ncbi:MAG: GNAT family N-acetyltransferase [Devosia sp.]